MTAPDWFLLAADADAGSAGGGSVSWWWATLSFLASEFVAICTLPVVLLRRKEPAGTVAWILAILLMPLFGTVLFLAFGNDRLARQADKRRRRKRKVADRVSDLVLHQDSPIAVSSKLQLFKLLRQINPFPPVKGNSVEILSDMELNYAEQLEAIRHATRYVHMEYYIFQTDEVGARFRDELVAAARRGVTVRFLYDAVGSWGLKKKFLKDMRQAGIRVSSFIPFSVFTRRWIFNFRNHRKILVVDGVVGFVGGANIGDEYIGKSEVGHWMDRHLRVRGPILGQLQQVFFEDWAFATDVRLDAEALVPPVHETGDVVAQVIPGGPDQDVPTYMELYFSIIASAESRLRITTPYFVPPEPLVTALQTAARRGVDVKILVPGRTTHPFVQYAARSYYAELLEAGVHIYEYTPGFLHGKVVTVDEAWGVLGTANFDIRSMKLNFEIGVGFYEPRIVRQLNDDFERLIDLSRPILLEHWNERNLVRRVCENFTRLFSPVL